MENNKTKTGLVHMLTEPDNINRAFNDPKNFGLEVFNNMSSKEKQYLSFAAGAALIIYGIVLGRQK